MTSKPAQALRGGNQKPRVEQGGTLDFLHSPLRPVSSGGEFQSPAGTDDSCLSYNRRSPDLAFFDDQGTLDFAENDCGAQRISAGPKQSGKADTLSAPDFAGSFYNLIGRPFKSSKHLPSSTTQTHLGLVILLQNFVNNEISLEPKPGKLEEISKTLKSTRDRRPCGVSLGEIMTLAGQLH